MRPTIYTLLLIFSFTIAKGQNLHVNIFAGATNYQGDLQASRFTFNQAHGAFGAGLLYEITEKLYARFNIMYGTVSGADSKSALNKDRNLSFSSPITEVQLGAEYDIFNLYETSITPYIFAGIAGYHFNPSAINNQGQKVYLQPLGTEGQGFYQGRQKYALTQMSIPFGGGLKLALNDNVRLRFEVGLRKLFTDYLDDVSTIYIDKNNLLLHNGQQAVDMAFRANEIKPILVYPAEGNKRGNPKSKDWYYFTGIGISFRIVSGDGSRGSKSQLGCPVRVY